MKPCHYLSQGLFMILLSACGPAPIPPAERTEPPVQLPKHYEWISPQAAARLIADTPQLGLADVRTEEEYAAPSGRLAKALLAPYLADNRATLEKMERDRPWLLYCALGPRSEATAADMATMGFQKVYLLRGGFNAWLAAGLPVEK
jgi:rhodanese-related sulfurtransferase